MQESNLRGIKCGECGDISKIDVSEVGEQIGCMVCGSHILTELAVRE